MAARESTKDIQEKLIHNMERWQKIEDHAVTFTGEMQNKAKNPIIQHIAKIIQRDSEMHRRTQELIVETLRGTVSLTPEEITDVWDMIEKHIETEKQAVQMAEEAKALLKSRKMTVQEYLVQYLLTDEEKHNDLLDQLRLIKDKMYPY